MIYNFKRYGLLLVDYFLPRANLKQNIESKNDYRSTIFTILVAFCTTLFYVPYCYLVGMPLMSKGCAVTPPLSIIGLMLIKFLDKRNVASIIVLTGIWITISIAFFTGGLGSSPPIVWFFVFPVAATIMQGGKWGIFWTFLSLFTLFGLEIWRFNSGFTFSEFTPLVMFYTNLVNVSIGSFILVMFVSYALITKQNALMTVKLQESELRREKDRGQKLLTILFHDLGRNASLLSGYLELSGKKALDPLSKEKVYRLSEEIKSILQGAKDLDINEISIQKELVLFSYVLDLALDPFQDQFRKKNIQINKLGNFEFLLYVNKSQMVNHVLANIISNATKFSHLNGTITIESKMEFSHHLINISNQGLPYSNGTVQFGTTKELGSGLGLKIVEDFSKMNDIDFKIMGNGDTTTANLRVKKIKPER